MTLSPLRNIWLKFLSISIATLLWLVVAGDRIVERALRVPIEFQNLPVGLEIVGDQPESVDVRLRASSGALGRLGPSGSGCGDRSAQRPAWTAALSFHAGERQSALRHRGRPGVTRDAANRFRELRGANRSSETVHRRLTGRRIRGCDRQLESFNGGGCRPRELAARPGRGDDRTHHRLPARPGRCAKSSRSALPIRPSGCARHRLPKSRCKSLQVRAIGPSPGSRSRSRIWIMVCAAASILLGRDFGAGDGTGREGGIGRGARSSR